MANLTMNDCMSGGKLDIADCEDLMREIVRDHPHILDIRYTIPLEGNCFF